MIARTASWLLVFGFAVAVGHLAWHSLVGPPPVRAYPVGGDVPVMGAPEAGANLYLRRALYLPQRPRHAWLQLLGRDMVMLHINGVLVRQVELPGYPVAVLVDVTPNLQQGENVLAITSRQTGLDAPPVVAVAGAYVLTDGEHLIAAGPEWRCNTAFDRKAAWWFEPKFDDAHWPRATVHDDRIVADVGEPARAVTVASQAEWVGSPAPEARVVALRREFEVAGRPRQAWLRLAATAAYRLRVNGILLDQQEDQLATDVPVPPSRRTYDITPAVRAGGNVVEVVLTATGTPPHLRADGEVEDAGGGRLYFATDPSWVSRLPAADEGAATASPWGPCRVATGDMKIVPWDMKRQTVALALPVSVAAWRLAGQIGLILAIALVTLLSCMLVERLLAGASTGTGARPRIGGVYLALAPATAGIAFALLATFDPRVFMQDVYRGVWVVAAVASVLVQWLALALFGFGRWAVRREYDPAWGSVLRPTGIALALVLLTFVTFWLRYRDIAVEPLHWDEVSNWTIVEGFRARGFPSNTVRADMPIAYLNTNELSHTFAGLNSFLISDPTFVLRVPGILFSVLTMLLLYVVGRDLFRTWTVGMVAATIFAFAPVIIAVSTFGRYFAALQFFTLLTVWGYWHTIKGTGPINHKALWLTGLSFIAVFLSWEGGGLIALGLMLTGLVLRRGRMATILCDGQVWLAMLLVAAVILLQLGHRTLQQTQSLWVGISASDADVRPLWRYAIYQPWYYVFESSWNQDALVPMLLLIAAGVLAVKHPWRRPLRYLFVFHLATCVLTASLLSIVAWRYTHHLVPMMILLGAATIVALTHALVRVGRRPAAALAESVHARAVGLALVAAILVAGSGMLLQSPKLELFRVQGYTITQFKYVNLGGASLYLKDRVQPGDVVLAHQPYTTNFFVGARRADWWLQTTLHMTETLDDLEDIPVDRRDGTPLLGSLAALENVFASNRRIWYVVAPSGHAEANGAAVSSFLREHMDVVYEDWKTMVLFRAGNHRPASLRQDNADALRQASFNLLP